MDDKANVTVRVSGAQVWSAAIQNVMVAAIIGAAWLLGKLGSEIAVPSLLAVAGIDLFSRLRADKAPLAAIAVGATGVLSRLPHLSVLVATISLLLSGCGLIGQRDVRTARDVVDAAAVGVDQGLFACGLAEKLADEPAVADVCKSLVEAKRAADRASKLLAAAPH